MAAADVSVRIGKAIRELCEASQPPEAVLNNIARFRVHNASHCDSANPAPMLVVIALSMLIHAVVLAVADPLYLNLDMLSL